MQGGCGAASLGLSFSVRKWSLTCEGRVSGTVVLSPPSHFHTSLEATRADIQPLLTEDNNSTLRLHRLGISRTRGLH